MEYSAAAENIAQISPPSGASADLFFDMWMESDGHRANILSSDFTQVGIAVSSNDEKIIAVLVFMVKLFKLFNYPFLTADQVNQ